MTDTITISKDKPESELWYRVKFGLQTMYSGKDRDYAIEKAKKLNKRNPKVICIIEQFSHIWENNAAVELRKVTTSYEDQAIDEARKHHE